MSVIACILFNMVVFFNGSYCPQYYVGIQEKAPYTKNGASIERSLVSR